MSDIRVMMQLDGERQEYWPGERLSGSYRLIGAEADEVTAVEVSIHWFTDGKGDKDVGVHFQEKRGADDLRPHTQGNFATELPPSPLSYDGFLFKIIWCVQVRATLRRGKPLEGVAYFLVGAVARACVTYP